MHKNLVTLCLAALVRAENKYYNTNFNDLHPTPEGPVGVYNDLNFSETRLAQTGARDSPIQGVQLNTTPNAIYYDGGQAILHSANNGTFHLKRFSAGCVAHGNPTPCSVSILAYYRDEERPFNGQTAVLFTPTAGESMAPITVGLLSSWRFFHLGKVNITTTYKEVSPEEDRTILDDVVYCWEEEVASCWPFNG